MKLSCVSLAFCFWFGLLSSFSPCSLATNITSVSFLTNKLPNLKQILLVSSLYALGHCLAYIVLAMLILKGLLSVTYISFKYFNFILGPLLILIGMFLLELLEVNLPIFLELGKNKQSLLQSKYLGSFILGILFALSFCPISAAFYFGSLIPLALAMKSFFVFPLIYGLASSMPVLIITILSALGIKKMSKIFSSIAKLESLSRIFTGSIFILAGIYYTLIFIFGIQL